jgi:hypothetical protein
MNGRRSMNRRLAWASRKTHVKNNQTSLVWWLLLGRLRCRRSRFKASSNPHLQKKKSKRDSEHGSNGRIPV